MRIDKADPTTKQRINRGDRGEMQTDLKDLRILLSKQRGGKRRRIGETGAN